MRLKLRLILPAVVLVLGGCVGELADLVSLQRDLIAEYPGTEISINVRNRSNLEISMRTADTAERSEGEREAVAREVGRTVMEHYSGASRLESVTVVFGTTSGVGPATITRDGPSFSFTAEQLADSAETPTVEVIDRAQVAS
jgi:hypothetical protein